MGFKKKKKYKYTELWVYIQSSWIQKKEPFFWFKKPNCYRCKYIIENFTQLNVQPKLLVIFVVSLITNDKASLQIAAFFLPFWEIEIGSYVDRVASELNSPQKLESVFVSWIKWYICKSTFLKNHQCLHSGSSCQTSTMEYQLKASLFQVSEMDLLRPETMAWRGQNRKHWVSSVN